MKKSFLILFIAASLGVLLSGFFDMALLRYISKPLIMISLAMFYVTSARSHRSPVVIGAMIFSLAGDVFLLDDKYFIAGLIAFLLAHLLYIFAYKQHRHEESEDVLSGVHRARLAFPIILAGTGLVVVLYPVLGALKVPVIFYATVLVAMVITALFRYGHTSSRSFWMVFAGAVFFMISDSLLAVNKFLQPVANAAFWIMLTYVAAQFLIIKGLLEHRDRV